MFRHFAKILYTYVIRHKRFCVALLFFALVGALLLKMRVKDLSKFAKIRTVRSHRKNLRGYQKENTAPTLVENKDASSRVKLQNGHSAELHESLEEDPLSEPSLSHAVSHTSRRGHADAAKDDALRNGTGNLKQWSPSMDQKHALQTLKAKHPLNFDQDDVLVFLHIPKTSGKTFNAHLVRDMKVPKRLECVCVTMEKPHGCKCLNGKGSIWLFSRLTTAWPCGVHPSWSDLSTECLNQGMDRKEKKTRKRRFSVVTMLRSPYLRYISEWHQVKEDGQWTPFHKLTCYPLSRDKSCYEDDWRGVTLEQFLSCPSNPANNRQVRMLADLTIANCSQIFEWLESPTSTNSSASDAATRYQHIINNPVLLSAIHNLNSLPFFGLEEYQRETEYLFARTFGLSFSRHFRQTKTFSEQVVISKEQRERILDLNRIDLVFYRYAKELFFKRLHENIKRKHVFFTDDLGLTTEHPPIS